MASASRNTAVQLRLLLLPDRKQRHRSKIRTVTNGAVHLMETVIFSRIESGASPSFSRPRFHWWKNSPSSPPCVPQVDGRRRRFCLLLLAGGGGEDELHSAGLRLRLYTSERLRRERLLGEAYLGLGALDLTREQQLVLPLVTKPSLKVRTLHPQT